MQMENIKLYPLQFQPVYKDYIWGGNKIAARYNRKLPQGIYAESWEIADRPEGMSVVINGPLAGKDLFSLMKLYGEQLTGRAETAAGRPCEEFPLLIKIIDARDKLSVQVHPDETGARQTGGDPKTEMWYVLDAEKGAAVYVGLKAGVTREIFKRGLETGKAGELLQEIPVARGDVVYLPGGRIHAIGPGCMMLEVMQSSNTTFRLFDWNRVGRDGQPRALQISKAIKVIRWDDQAVTKIAAAERPLKLEKEGYSHVELLSTPFFRLEKLILSRTVPCATSGRTFHALFVEEGVLELKADNDTLRLESGMTVLVPAAVAEYSLAAGKDPATVLRISLP
jgi:mannose-6-phosphate isomerase